MPEYTKRQLILRRKAALWTERSAWDTDVRDSAELILPRSAQFDWTRTNQRNDDVQRILDDTGTMAHTTLTAGLMAGSTSPARPWMRLATPDKELMQYAPVKTWLFNVTNRMFSIFGKSNTYRAFKHAYSQLAIAGVAANVVVDNYENVLHHYPQVFGRYALALNHLGFVDTIYREMTKTVAQLVEEFGKAQCSITVQNMYDNGNLDAKVPIIHAIEPRRDRDPRKIDGRNKRWASCYLEAGGNEDKFLREAGFDEFPALCPRWDVEGDDTYSARWPALNALGGVRQLQHQQLRKGQAIDYQVNPPLQIPVELKNNPVDRLPGGSNYYTAQTQTGGIRSLFEVKLDSVLLLEDIRDVRMRIDRAFFRDLFLMAAQDDRSGTTAREIAERHEEKLLMLGPVLESLHTEMLQPFVEIAFTKMLRAGMLTGDLAPPQELHGQDLDVEFVSVLAQAQRAVGTQSVDRLVGTIGTLMALKPEVGDKLDGDQVVDVYSDLLGADPSIIVADDKVAMIRSQRAQQQQAATMAAMAAPMKDAALAGKAMAEAQAVQA